MFKRNPDGTITVTECATKEEALGNINETLSRIQDYFEAGEYESVRCALNTLAFFIGQYVGHTDRLEDELKEEITILAEKLIQFAANFMEGQEQDIEEAKSERGN